jgi:cytochrome c553
VSRRLRTLARVSLALGCLSLGGCDWSPAKSSGSPEQLYQLCASCHGGNGEGNPRFHAPAIAGLPQWYIEAQLVKFRSGARGTHFQDITGMSMRPMAVSLHNDRELKTVAAHVANLPKASHRQTLLEGDAARGQTLYATCAACHGPQAGGNEQLKAPPLHNSDWYLLAQLQKFRQSVRGGDPRDIEGAQMVPQAQVLSDEQAVKDVVAHIMTLQ